MTAIKFNKLKLFLLVVCMTCLIADINCGISLMNYYQAEHTLAHVIRSVKENKLEGVDDQYEQKCTKSNNCCICSKNFRNSSYLQLHMKIHHHLEQQKPQDTMIIEIFDKRVNSEFRFETCLKMFNLIDLNRIMQKQKELWSEKSQQSNLPVIFLNQTLNRSEIVDTCTIVAYGAYHKPLWSFWVKGILVFVFAIIFLVYYANIIDQINAHFFPKKKNRKQPSMGS